MTGAAFGLLVLVLAGLGALGWSVVERRPDVERWAAPGVAVGIALLGVSLDPAWNGTRWWFIAAALLLGAAEGVRISGRVRESRLVILGSAGLFAIGFGVRDPVPVAAVIGIAVFVVVLLELGRPLLVAVVERSPQDLPVNALLVVGIGWVLVMAFSSGSLLGVVGAAALLVAVLVVAYRRHVFDLPWMNLAGTVGLPFAAMLLMLSVIQP